jgi:hypothetical protein
MKNQRATNHARECSPRAPLLQMRLTANLPRAISARSPALARRYIQHVASAEGQAVFRRHGFMDASGKY